MPTTQNLIGMVMLFAIVVGAVFFADWLKGRMGT